MPTSDEQNRRALVRPHLLIDYADSLPGPRIKLDRELASEWRSTIEDLLRGHIGVVDEKGSGEEHASTAGLESALVDRAYEFAAQDPEAGRELGQLEKIQLQSKHFLVPEPVTMGVLIVAAIKILQTKAEFAYKGGKWTINLASGAMGDAAVVRLLQVLTKALQSRFPGA